MSEIPKFSLLEYVVFSDAKTALQKQIHDIDTDRSNMCRDHENGISSMGSRQRIRLRVATIHYSSIKARIQNKKSQTFADSL